MTTSAELAAQVGVAVSELNTAKNIFEGIREDTNERLEKAENEFAAFIGGDFADAVNGTKDIIVYVDPVDGSDSNNGLSASSSVKTSDKVYELVGGSLFDVVLIYIRKGTEFSLMHIISASVQIKITSWTANDGAVNKPILRQGLPKRSNLNAPNVALSAVEVSTYTAVENEQMPPVYDYRAFFRGVEKLRMISSKVNVVDNQLLHIHSSGSGDSFHRRSISIYGSSISVLPSAVGVIDSVPNIVSWFGTAMAVPFDFFAKTMTLELNGQHANLDELLNVPSDYLSTNVSLTMV